MKKQQYTITENVKIEGLKTTILLLQTEFSVLEGKKTDLQKMLNDFRIRHNRELGEILGDILRLRLEEFEQLHDKNPDKPDDDAYTEAKREYKFYKEAFRKAREEMVMTLSKEQKKELQKKFHKASKMCHPDLVSDELKEQAQHLFTDLNNAYYRNDLNRIEEILHMLENSEIGLIGKQKVLSQQQQLELYETKLRTDILKLKGEIAAITDSASYQTIREIEDWDTYFARTRKKMIRERDELQEKVRGDTHHE